ncbi:MAG: elongation factor Ts [Azospirillum sp.]|nr:elongation factor Ts [Azospirillum sp.]
MAEITASLVKELREKTGVGMMDCKKALGETAGDIEAAVDWLRKKGLAAAAKKAGRVAAEGLVAVATSGGHAAAGAVIELNSETDFVARNDRFQATALTLAELALAGSGDVDALRAASYPGTGQTAAEVLTHLVATIGENMSLRRSARLAVDHGVVASYVHSALAPNLGKIGVLVALDSPSHHPRLAELGKQLAMHIAAARPDAVDITEIDPEKLARERDILSDQARASGKPEAVIAKMVEGRLRKYYEDVVLLEQTFVIDGESKVAKVVEAAAKEIGAPIKVTGFVRFALGEGIDKGSNDFASEVAAVAGQPSPAGS